MFSAFTKQLTHLQGSPDRKFTRNQTPSVNHKRSRESIDRHSDNSPVDEMEPVNFYDGTPKFACPFSKEGRPNPCPNDFSKAKNVRRSMLRNHLNQIKVSGGDVYHPINDPLWRSSECQRLMMKRPEKDSEEVKKAKANQRSRDHYARKRLNYEENGEEMKVKYENAEITREEYEQFLPPMEKLKFKRKRASEEAVEETLSSRPASTRPSNIVPSQLDATKIEAKLKASNELLSRFVSLFSNSTNFNWPSEAGVDAFNIFGAMLTKDVHHSYVPQPGTKQEVRRLRKELEKAMKSGVGNSERMNKVKEVFDSSHEAYLTAISELRDESPEENMETESENMTVDSAEGRRVAEDIEEMEEFWKKAKSDARDCITPNFDGNSVVDILQLINNSESLLKECREAKED